MPVCVQKQCIKHWTQWTKFKNSKKVQSSVIFSSFSFWKTHRTKPSSSFAVAQWLLVRFTAESSILKSTDWTQGTFDWVVGQNCRKQKAVILSLPRDSKQNNSTAIKHCATSFPIARCKSKRVPSPLLFLTTTKTDATFWILWKLNQASQGTEREQKVNWVTRSHFTLGPAVNHSYILAGPGHIIDAFHYMIEVGVSARCSGGSQTVAESNERSRWLIGGWGA